MTEQLERQVAAAAAAIVTAFGSHDFEAYFAGFADDASFIFHTTPERLESREAYERLWREWERSAGFRVIGCSSTNGRVQVYGDVGVFVHDVETTLQMDGEQSTVSERETIVFHHRAGAWLAVHEHLSPQP